MYEAYVEYLVRLAQHRVTYTQNAHSYLFYLRSDPTQLTVPLFTNLALSTDEGKTDAFNAEWVAEAILGVEQWRLRKAPRRLRDEEEGSDTPYMRFMQFLMSHGRNPGLQATRVQLQERLTRLARSWNVRPSELTREVARPLGVHAQAPVAPHHSRVGVPSDEVRRTATFTPRSRSSRSRTATARSTQDAHDHHASSASTSHQQPAPNARRSSSPSARRAKKHP